MDSVNPVGPVGQNPRAWRNLTSRMGSAARCTGAWANAGICCSRALEGYADRINPAHAFHCRAALGLATSSLRSAATASGSTWPVTANQLGIDRHLAVDLCGPGRSHGPGRGSPPPLVRRGNRYLPAMTAQRTMAHSGPGREPRWRTPGEKPAGRRPQRHRRLPRHPKPPAQSLGAQRRDSGLGYPLSCAPLLHRHKRPQSG